MAILIILLLNVWINESVSTSEIQNRPINEMLFKGKAYMSLCMISTSVTSYSLQA